MRRKEFLHTHPDFHPGMLAFSDDGQELGEIQKLDEENLTIEKGQFFSMDRRLPYEAVADIRGDHVIINRGLAELDERKNPNYEGLQGAREADVEQAQSAVPIFQKDLEQLERTEQNVDTTGTSFRDADDIERASTEYTPADRQTGPMSGGETFRDESDESIEARRDVRSTSWEDSGKTAPEAIDLDRERILKDREKKC